MIHASGPNSGGALPLGGAIGRHGGGIGFGRIGRIAAVSGPMRKAAVAGAISNRLPSRRVRMVDGLVVSLGKLGFTVPVRVGRGAGDGVRPTKSSISPEGKLGSELRPGRSE